MRSNLSWLLVLLLCLAGTGCFVRVAPAPGVEVDWHYYPTYDIYWSSVYGWSYWDGGTWVLVRTRPSWIAIAPGARSVTVRAGPLPYSHWAQHVTYRQTPRYAPRAHRGPGHGSPRHR